MCGVLFSYQTSPSQEFQKNANFALSKLSHRGPDASEIIFKNNWAIGHTRLSIIDLESSKQPMSSPGGRQLLSFNGEIYNYKQLKSDLAKRWNFKTNGDTEVILAGICLEGPKFIEKLDGMWAFVFWNVDEQKLIASRDRLGKKPLYYVNNRSSISFSSELPALYCIEPYSFSHSHTSTEEFLKYGFCLPGKTMYKQVFEVKPGEFCTWSPTQKLRFDRYWKLKKRNNTTLEINEVKYETANLLEKAVEKRLIADVEVGSFLSGGIDSSIVSQLACKLSPQKIKTFNIKFLDSGFDESQYARLVANHLETEHFEFEIRNLSPENMSELVEKNIGQPFGDPSILAVAALCKHTALNVKVALSGDGADELFSGYQRYQAKILIKWYSNLPKTMKTCVHNFLKSLPDSYAHHSKSIVKKSKLFLELANSGEFNRGYIAPITIDEKMLSELLPDTYRSPDPTLFESEQTLSDMMYEDLSCYLPQDILAKADRASMAHSLEIRTPFLDRDLVEYITQLDLAKIRSNFSGKRLLKDTFSNNIPNKIIRRRKQGFSSPIYSWFLGEAAVELESLCSNLDTTIRKEKVMDIIGEHKSKKADRSLQLWNIYSYLKWIESKHP
ncbi:asparagine synthase (glutamine-hydrolyzing) [Ketobacter sp. MCCC 1A13808]|uniref:asparagine synthase (glutamine-hydrolyzing) n=1 Tax=Ketobacter sp. MCCC 1A13808 TaxID=2602738 RepID=UPI0012EBA5A8|nr:asparagine synthase (glutamine-hydrolyzing) [Ketobacter sp. MCCC 1A13808]MVF11180.1 asparagine synthase (glutamine-hydrolyzing) [Ketobacter sp. MCCC 1A13808]